MNTPVSAPIAKLLKEIGFDEPTKLCVSDDDDRPLPFDAGRYLHRNNIHPYYSTPIISDLLMWFYEKYSIWIQGPFPLNNGKWEWVIFYLKEPLQGSNGFKNKMSITEETPYYNTLIEAYEAAIIYALTTILNLKRKYGTNF